MPGAFANTIPALFAHNDWARDKLMTLAGELTENQLDRPFEMGFGTLRATLRHLYGAERIWFERWRGTEQPQFPRTCTISAMTELWTAFRDLAQARNELIDSSGVEGLQRVIGYADPDGEVSRRLGDLMLHVCNHGFHHRAQALNMLRHVGVEKLPGLDYLFMKVEQPAVEYSADIRKQLREAGVKLRDTLTPPDQLDLEMIQMYYRYNDWACEIVFALAEGLSDEALDRPFEIGLGTLRKTLLHIRDAEHWWYENWVSGPQAGYQEMPETTSIADLKSAFSETAAKRDAYLNELTDTDLERLVAAEVRPELILSFGLGESMLQLCGHGTHHRAQALNMLRQLGTEVPPMDYVDWLRVRAPSASERAE